jgi:hypothetical protein
MFHSYIKVHVTEDYRRKFEEEGEERVFVSISLDSM